MTSATADSEQARSVVQVLRERAQTHPSRLALVATDQSFTYEALFRRVAQVAGALRARGVSAGERVLLAGGSSAFFPAAYFATHVIGAIAVPVDPTAPASRHADIARLAGAQVTIGLPEPLPGVPALVLDEASAADDGPNFADPDANAASDLLFTSGTTGTPKGILLSHRNVVAAARQINAVIGNGEDDVEIVPLPLSHSFGLGRLRCNVLAGGTIVLTRGFRLPGEIFAALRAHRATGLVGVPAGFAILLRFGARGLGSYAEQLRYVEIGSAPMPLAHKQQLMELLPKTKLFMHYGLTEASRSAFIEFHRDREHLDTIGRPTPGVTIEVRDEDGREAADAARGTLWIRGPHTAGEYWNDAERSAAVFVDGWVRTGDLAERRAQGFLALHGRVDDMINVGGFNVSPDEVERVLEAHPAVAEAACIGVVDPQGIAGQVVRACVVLAREHEQPDDATLQSWTAERLESYKIPTQYAWLSALPRTASGKLQRAALREQLASTTEPNHG